MLLGERTLGNERAHIKSAACVQPKGAHCFSRALKLVYKNTSAVAFRMTGIDKIGRKEETVTKSFDLKFPRNSKHLLCDFGPLQIIFFL
jgi:hypothetical protein